MLKWLSNARPRSRSDLVTDDPLATISVAQKESKTDLIYSVSRLNPLFEDDGYPKGKKRWQKYLKESSSGYGSRNSSDNTVHTNPGFEADRDASFEKEAITILEQNTSFVKNILVAVRRKESTTLNPIPEDKINIDYTIPRPVWPRHDKYKKQHTYKNESQTHDWHSEHERATPPRGDNFIIRPKVSHEDTADTTQQILQELAHTIKHAIDQKTQLSPEDLLRTLRNSMNKNWDIASSDSAVRQLSETLNQSEVATISRAFSHTSSFSKYRNRPLSDAEAGRLSLLQRLGKLSLYEPPTPAYEKHVRESSTSSEETSSGFSELYHSPTTSTSSADFPFRRSPENTNVPLFTHEHISHVTNGVRNAVLYGSSMQCRDGQNEYEKLNFRERKSSNEDKNDDILEDLSLSNWNDANAPKQYDAQNQSSNLTIPGYNAPDFTLDTHQAERLMHKIQATKRQRCWCRTVTCLFGLLFLLLSVMAVSMFLTRGQRMFGSL